MSNPPKILVIDDHAGIRTLLSAFLGRTYEVTALSSGNEGLSYLYFGDGAPDLIVLDMDMPDVNGKEFLEQLRFSGFFGNIPVVMVSGCEDEAERRACTDLGAREVFNKPFNPTHLQDTIQHLLTQN